MIRVMNNPTIAVLIVTFNSSTDIARCIRAIASPLVTQIIVVDNDSKDATPDLVRALSREDDRIQFIQNSRNIGFAAAVNRAAEAATEPLLLLLNPDTELSPPALPLLQAEFRDPEIGIAGPYLRLPGGRMDPACARFEPTLRDSVMHILPGLRGWARYHDRNPGSYVDSISGACLLIRARAFKEVGGLDEAYWMYGEDLDLCLQVRRRGYRIAFVRTAVVLHIKGASRPVGAPRRGVKATYEFYNALGIYFRKNLAAGAPSVLPHLVILACKSVGVMRGGLNGASNWLNDINRLSGRGVVAENSDNSRC